VPAAATNGPAAHAWQTMRSVMPFLHRNGQFDCVAGLQTALEAAEGSADRTATACVLLEMGLIWAETYRRLCHLRMYEERYADALAYIDAALDLQAVGGERADMAKLLNYAATVHLDLGQTGLPTMPGMTETLSSWSTASG
jgi:hypothetical protein